MRSNLPSSSPVCTAGEAPPTPHQRRVNCSSAQGTGARTAQHKVPWRQRWQEHAGAAVHDHAAHVLLPMSTRFRSLVNPRSSSDSSSGKARLVAAMVTEHMPT